MGDRRSPSAGRRSLTFFIVAALLVGGGLALAGLATRGGGDDVVLVVDDAVADIPPTTIEPRRPADDAAVEEIDDAVAEPNRPTGDATPTGNDEMSALASELPPRRSAIPEDVAPRPRPVGLQVDSIDVARFPVRAVGLEPDGQLEIPDETEIGWYRYGATAGQPGATVLAAHVSWNRTVGPFARLGSVDPGAQVEVTLDDGTTRNYVVVERAVYGKLELPRDRIWRTTGDETLVLITCGGAYNPDIRRFTENIVVYAVPIA